MAIKAIKSTDPRKPRIVAALKKKYDCRKITTVKMDTTRKVVTATVMNRNALDDNWPRAPYVTYQEAGLDSGGDIPGEAFSLPELDAFFQK